MITSATSCSVSSTQFFQGTKFNEKNAGRSWQLMATGSNDEDSDDDSCQTRNNLKVVQSHSYEPGDSKQSYLLISGHGSTRPLAT